MRRISSGVGAVGLLSAMACGGGAATSLLGEGHKPNELMNGDITRSDAGAVCASGSNEIQCPTVDASGPPAAVDAGPPPLLQCHPTFFGTSTWNDNFTDVASAEANKHITVHGTACMDCHTAPTKDGAPVFDFGGRVFDEHGAPLPLAEISVINTSSGKPISAYSNLDGYFWWPPPPEEGGYGDSERNAPVAGFPSEVGVRTKAGKKVAMCAKAINGNCGSCHGKTTDEIDSKLR